MCPTLHSTLQDHPALAFGISGVLASPLTSRDELAQLVRTARDAGITLFDTAPAYGSGEGERRLGQALKNDRDGFVMTKAGLSSRGVACRSRDFEPAAIVESVEESLRRLRRERLDLVWLHGPSRSELTPNLFEVLGQLKSAGKVAHFGVAGRGEELLAACQFDIFEAVMTPMHAALSSHQRNLGAEVRASGRLLFGIECLATARADCDGWSRGAAWRALRRLGRRETNAPPRVMTPAQAFDWAFDDGGCDVVVTTTSRRQRLEANIAACAHRRIAPSPPSDAPVR